MRNVTLTAANRVKKYDDAKCQDMKDVQKLWGNKPKEMQDAHRDVQNKAMPSQVDSTRAVLEDIKHKSVFALRTRGVQEDWRVEKDEDAEKITIKENLLSRVQS